MTSATAPVAALRIPAFGHCVTTAQPLQCIDQTKAGDVVALEPHFDVATGDTFDAGILPIGAATLRNHQLLGACEMYRKAQSLQLPLEQTRSLLTPFATCPITRDLMRTPVRGPDNHVYELSAITEHLKYCGTSPMTRQPMHGEIVFTLDRHMRHLSAFCDPSISACTQGASHFVLHAAAPSQTMSRDAEVGLAPRFDVPDVNLPFSCVMGIIAGSGIIACGWPALMGLFTAGMVYGCGTAAQQHGLDGSALPPVEDIRRPTVALWPGEPTAL